MSTTTLPDTTWPEPQLADADMHDLLLKSQNYLRRIHWWVRLFGIIWIVIPAVAALAAIGFLLGALAAGS